MSQKDKKFIADEIDKALERMELVKEDFLEGKNPVDLAGELHNCIAQLSHVAFLMGQEALNMVYEKYLPKDTLTELKAKLVKDGYNVMGDDENKTTN